MSDFAHHLIALRHARGLSQAQLAARAKCDAAVVSRLENGLRPRLDHVVKLAAALDADQAELLALAAGGAR